MIIKKKSRASQMVCKFSIARFFIDIFTEMFDFFYSPSSLAFSDTEVPTEDLDEKVLTKQRNPHNPVSRVSGKKLSVKHITALTIKRFHHSKRNKKGLVCEVGRGGQRLDMLINTHFNPRLYCQHSLFVWPWSSHSSPLA